MTAEQDLSPLVKTVEVPVGVDRAFEAFTAETSAWWPLFSHSVGGEAAHEVRLEGAVGGRIAEYGAGEPAVWGTVSEWDPPASLSFSWHPGGDPAEAGQVTVTFTAAGDGTEVKLVHSGWERRGDGGGRARLSYDTGWDYVLGKYVEHSRS